MSRLHDHPGGRPTPHRRPRPTGPGPRRPGRTSGATRSQRRYVPVSAPGDRRVEASLRRLAIVGLRLGAIDTAALPNLAPFVAHQQPDQLLLIIGPPHRARHDTDADHEIGRTLAALTSACPGPIDLQIPYQASGDVDRWRGCRVRPLPARHEITPGWTSTIATRGESRQYPGLAAIDLARRSGTSVMIGGVDRPGMISETTLAADGTPHTLWGIEIVSLPVCRPHYGSLPEAALCVLTISPTGRVTPALIPTPTVTSRRNTRPGRALPYEKVERLSKQDS